jgi:hypothetical protein
LCHRALFYFRLAFCGKFLYENREGKNMEIQNQILASGANTTSTVGWLMIAFLGLGLASSSGLNTFLPLLMLATAAKFSLFGVQLGGSYAWLGSDTALGVLALATVVEIAADKIPAVDHALDVFGTFARPVAGSVAAASVFTGLDPALATIAGAAIGAPAALGFHAAKSGARVTSSATTFGCANPFLSFLEDIAAFFLTLAAFLLPLIVPLLVAIFAIVLWRLIQAARRLSPRRKNVPDTT